MTTKTLEADNLIAEFDGWKFMKMVGEFPLWQKFDDKGAVVHEGIFRSPSYNTWNLLMPVGQKIISLGWQFQLNCYGVSNDAKFISTDGKTCIQNVAWSTPFLATYNVVIDAIEFINKNK